MNARCAIGLVVLAFASGCGSSRTPETTPAPACVGENASDAGWADDGPPFFAVFSRMNVAASDAGRRVIPGLVAGAVTQAQQFASPSGDPHCEFIGTGMAAPHAGFGPSAGPVTLSATTALLVSNPYDAGDGTMAYTDAPGDASSALAPGDAISVASAGADVPAFRLDAVVPTPPTIWIPGAPTDGGAPTLYPDGGLTVAWSGASCGDQIVVELATRGLDTGSIERCLVAASAGSFPLPIPLPLPPNGFGVEVKALRQTSTDAGRWPVLWEITVPGMVRSGSGDGWQVRE